MPALPLAQRCAAINWRGVAADLDAYGAAVICGLLDAGECTALTAGYAEEQLYRSRIVMARYGFGRGEYKYFDYPLPPLVATLRTDLYPALASIANDWYRRLRMAPEFPPNHAEFVARCHTAGQRRPTPLILRYAAGDFNCLHQDLYGEHVFPLQVAVLLSMPGTDFSGGEFVLTEQRPRQQSRVEVVALSQGDAVVFAVQQRPVNGTRGVHRVTLRHGVSRLRSGQRLTLGVIFHEAQ